MTTQRKPSTKRVPADKQQISVYLHRQTVEDGKDAAAHVMGRPGAPSSWSALVDEAVAAYVDTLAAQFNNGEPFPARSAGALPPGPRLS